MNLPCYETFPSGEASYCLRVEAGTNWAFPYAQILHTEGTDDSLTVTLTTHDIVIAGTGLRVLLDGIAQHRIAVVRSGDSPGTQIRSVRVRPAREDASAEDTLAEQELLGTIAATRR